MRIFMQALAVLAIFAACIRVVPVPMQQALTSPCCPQTPCPSPPDAGQPPDAGTPPGPVIGALHTQGNGIFDRHGTRWHGKGANLMDTRSCNACSYQPPDKEEVKRRADELVAWGATFLRLDLESYATSGGRTHWASVLEDSAYLSDMVDIVRHIEAKPGVYVLVSLWADPSFGAEGRPTSATADTWRVLAHAFAQDPKVFFGVVNEPENNYDGSGDVAVWNAMNQVVQAIRAQEDADGGLHHLIAVQGTGGWARLLKYYITHPIPSDNVIYEAHIYNPASDFHNLVEVPAQTLPVVIGEFGPWTGLMELSDTQALITLANSLAIPWAAWTFHMRCEPNLLVDHSAGGCGIGKTLTPTEGWGTQLRAALQAP